MRGKRAGVCWIVTSDYHNAISRIDGGGEEGMSKTQWKNLWHSFRWMRRFAEPYEVFVWAGRDDVSRKALRIAMKGI